jgi:hypothetical protein
MTFTTFNMDAPYSNSNVINSLHNLRLDAQCNVVCFSYYIHRYDEFDQQMSKVSLPDLEY